MRSTIRDAAAAFVTAVVIAMTFDVLLQLLSSSIRVTGGIGPPWWARAAAHIVWMVAGIMVWLAAPSIASTLDDLTPDAAVSRRTVWAIVGTALMVVPPVWVAAQLVVLAIQLTWSGTWGSEARIFISGAYYGAVFLSITPWVASGVILRAWTRHMVSEG